VHTDVATVQRFVSLPGIVAVRWEQEMFNPNTGSSRLLPDRLGATTTIYAELAPSVWPALEEKLGAGKKVVFPLEESRAKLVLPPEVVAGLPHDGNSRVVEGIEYDIEPLRAEHNVLTHGTAVRIGSGLLMSFTKM
jgi:hypothetical protein